MGGMETEFVSENFSHIIYHPDKNCACSVTEQIAYYSAAGEWQQRALQYLMGTHNLGYFELSNLYK